MNAPGREKWGVDRARSGREAVPNEWNFGDGSPIVTTTSPVVTHAYAVARAQVFGWSVKVVDDAGVSDATGAAIRITP